jgi:hypothetical protein
MARKRNTPAKQQGARVDEGLVKRAVALRKKGLGLVKLTDQLNEEGFKSPTGKELRPQTVRQWLMRAMKVDHLEHVGGAAAVAPASAKEKAEQPKATAERAVK